MTEDDFKHWSKTVTLNLEEYDFVRDGLRDHRDVIIDMMLSTECPKTREALDLVLGRLDALIQKLRDTEPTNE